MLETAFSYKFDTNKDICDITVSAPAVNVSYSLRTHFVEPHPINIKDFGITLAQEPQIVTGYYGYFVKNVTPSSRAAIAGLKKYDHIIKVDNHCINENDKQSQLVKDVNQRLYEDKSPVLLYILRCGNIHQLLLTM